jgi:hypothetical protein
MSRIATLRERFVAGETLGVEDIRFLLDLVDTMLAYNLAEILPPSDICKPCPFYTAGVNMTNCDHDVEDCEEPMQLFFEGALETWYSQIAQSEEVEEQ